MRFEGGSPSGVNPRVLRALILLVFRSFWICEADEILSSHRQLSTPPLVAKNRVLRALILLVFRCFRLWGCRDFEQLSLALRAPACVYMRFEGGSPSGVKARVLRALILLVFRSFRICEADEILSSHRQLSTPLLVFRCVLKVQVRHPVWCRKIAFFGPWSCWCFGLFGSQADGSLRSHRQHSTLLLVVLCVLKVLVRHPVWCKRSRPYVDLRTTLKKIKAIILIFCWTVSIQVNHAEGHPDFVFS